MFVKCAILTIVQGLQLLVLLVSWIGIIHGQGPISGASSPFSWKYGTIGGSGIGAGVQVLNSLIVLGGSSRMPSRSIGTHNWCQPDRIWSTGQCKAPGTLGKGTRTPACWSSPRRFQNYLQGKHVLVQLDYVTTVAHINHQGALLETRSEWR